MKFEDFEGDSLIEEQLASQGVGCVQVDDGQVFVFTTAVLEMLLAKAIESGENKAVVFVKRGLVS